ncbi:hypothetical protein [Halomonas caseinilytica]|uniref:hypothetical protein n=1 Tax=Halomonas caseinilytica TaxID=438744 RepID=UPI0007E57DD1|nr:hypothetical protein [Halomonas caseinilytica]SEN16508.1 hypothetical protein SAMN04487952_1113 [Halomonas caseinilytica]
MGRWVFLVLAAFALAGCSDSDADSGQGEQVAPDLSNVIWQGYDRESFPDLYQAVGADAFARINDGVLQAAETVARKGMCGEVVDAAPSSSRSTAGSLVFYVDCADQSRFYISEADIEAGFSSEDKQPGDGEGNATQDQINGCRDMIRDEFSKAADLDIHTISGTGSEVTDSNVVRVQQDFTVTNGIGDESDKTAICRFQGQRTVGNMSLH